MRAYRYAGWLIAALMSRCVPCVADAPATTPTDPLPAGYVRFDDSGELPPDDSADVTTAAPSAQNPKGRVTLDRFQALQWSPGTGRASSPGRMHVTYHDLATGTETQLTAYGVTIDTVKNQVQAEKGARLERADVVVTGAKLDYNLTTRTGYVSEALATGDYFRVSGARIETFSDGSLNVDRANFTTCVHLKPDYHIKARHLKIVPGKYVSARNIEFFAGPTKLIMWPSYRIRLTQSNPAPVPTLGYSKTDGVLVHTSGTPIQSTHEIGVYDLSFNMRREPTGLILYEHDLNRLSAVPINSQIVLHRLVNPLDSYIEQITLPTWQNYAENLNADEPTPRTTFTALIQSNQSVYNRRRDDLKVYRLPEIGLRIANILGHNAHLTATGAPSVVPVAPVLMDLAIEAGYIREMPTDVYSNRLMTRTDLASRPILIVPRLAFRAGITNWLNVYSSGTVYELFTPEAEISYLPTSTSSFGIAYRYFTDVGHTPFLFDRRDIRNEVRLRYRVGGPWAFGFTTRFDMDRSRSYDSEYAVMRNFDCLQVGLVYRVRSESLNVMINILPPTSDRAARMRTEPDHTELHTGTDRTVSLGDPSN